MDIDLDDITAVEAIDQAGMLPTVASSAAQVRLASAVAAESGLERLAADGRPRAVVCVGMGGSGIAGDVLRAVAGLACPVPIWVHKDLGLPGWVGASDLVIAVSCSGSTQETLSAAAEAVRRGAQLFGVGAVASPLSHLVEQARGPFVPVPGGRQPRASLWSLSVPVLMAAEQLDLLSERLELEATALRLEAVAASCHVARDAFVNPAKELALRLIGSRLAQIWGCSPLAGVAAYRFACQLNENAKVPAVQGILPEAAHNQIVAYDGVFAPGERDIFADPDVDVVATGSAGGELVQVLLRDPGAELDPVSQRAVAAADLATGAGIKVVEVEAEGVTRLERLASLICLTDFASVYAGIAAGHDPTPVHAITTLKERLTP